MASVFASRKAKVRIALVAAAVVVAIVAGVGGSQRPASGTGDALSYVTGHRLDLGAPGLAVGVVDEAGMHGAATGDLTVDEPIPVGSVTKSITALAVMQLVEAGAVRLDSPVRPYVPEFRTTDQAVSDRITVRELLSQTSGLPTRAGVDPLSRPASTLRRQVADLAHVVAAPAGRFTYSNANYEVLGDLVEHVTHDSWAAYVRTHILEPLDMRHTYLDRRTAEAAGIAEGHRIWFGFGVPTGTFYRADFLPAGFLISTASDLGHLLSAMLHGGTYHHRSVLSPAGVATLLRPVTSADALGLPGGYGLGWYQRPSGGLDVAIDPGSAQNVHADLVLVPSRHVGVVLLADGESDLYLGTIPRFDVAAINAATIAARRDSQGLVEGFYLIFDVLVLAALFLYTRTLIRVIRQRTSWYEGERWYRALFNAWRETFVPVVVLIELPAYYHESWPYLLTGDVGFVAFTVAVLGLAAFGTRAAFAVRHGRGPGGGRSTTPPVALGVAAAPGRADAVPAAPVR